MRKKILETAKQLIQKNGFDGMSFKDISKLIAIKTSSIHYYFPTKNDLAIALMKQEIEDLETFFKKLETASCSEKIQAFIDIFEAGSKEKKFCLCGMLSLREIHSDLTYQLDLFFTKCITFLKDCFNTKDEAQHFIATCEGGLLIFQNDPHFFTSLRQKALKTSL